MGYPGGDTRQIFKDDKDSESEIVVYPSNSFTHASNISTLFYGQYLVLLRTTRDENLYDVIIELYDLEEERAQILQQV